MTVLAHAGHWFESLLYLAPIVLVVVLVVTRGRPDEDGDGPHDDEADVP